VQVGAVGEGVGEDVAVAEVDVEFTFPRAGAGGGVDAGGVGFVWFVGFVGFGFGGEADGEPV
jgi:hypothetical protein